jgi:predicted metal-dependent hydrolase
MKRPASNTRGRLIPRSVRFDWSRTPLDWIPDEPFASYYINQINLILPAGEFWFCKLYNQALPLVCDEKLRHDMQMFMRQESMHARGHLAATKEYLKARGLDVERNQRVMQWLFDVALADAPLGRALPKFMQRRWLLFRLGIVAAIEHMTCVLGNFVLDNTSWDEAGADPAMADLVRWHGAEEVEHRSVAFDVYRHLGGGYASRYYLASIAVPAVFLFWADGAAHILRQDPRFAGNRPSAWRPWLWREWQRTSQRGHLPSIPRLLLQQLPFFSPWYDPEKEGSTEDALAYLSRSPAAQAAVP